MMVIEKQKKVQDIESDFVDALNGLPASLGNDYVSPFYRKGKNIFLRTLAEKKHLQVKLQHLRKV